MKPGEKSGRSPGGSAAVSCEKGMEGLPKIVPDKNQLPIYELFTLCLSPPPSPSTKPNFCSPSGPWFSQLKVSNVFFPYFTYKSVKAKLK
jgi:hypothetical protein